MQDSTDKKSAVVTGGAGFIGSRLAKRLIADGWSVVAIDAVTDYYDTSWKHNNISELKSLGVSFLEADLCELDLRGALVDASVVFHLAGQPGVRSSWGREFETYTKNNVNATQVLLEACVSLESAPKVVYASSSSVYGDAVKYPTSETTLPQPISPYGVTKLAAEHLVNLYANAFDLRTASLRYFTVYGPGQRPDMAFTKFTRSAVRGERIVINGTGKQIRDFTFVDDVVEANMLAATRETPPGAIYNIAGGSSVSVLDVITLLEGISGRSLDVQFGRPTPGDVTQTGGSVERANLELGWSSGIDLRDGLRMQYDWALKQFA